MSSERKHGLSREQLPVSAYVGSSTNLNDLFPEASSRGLAYMRSLARTTEVPSWRHSRVVLGAIGSFLEPF